jgi:2-oxoacid:acceptor oxidoreductase gamma subunit (pyruvate/2-ketoisovalerate family)
MQEIRFHGRGGQGSVIGSEVLAHAFFNEGKFVQSFPAFGVERRGAPVTAFCRIDAQHINLRSQIYHPDHVVVLDASMIENVNVIEGLKNNGTIVINSSRQPDFFRQFFGAGYRIFVIDAAGIAVSHRLGSAANPIVNTAILGAFAKATGLVGIGAVLQAIDEYVPVKKAQNQQAAKDAYDHVVEV